MLWCKRGQDKVPGLLNVIKSLLYTWELNIITYFMVNVIQWEEESGKYMDQNPVNLEGNLFKRKVFILSIYHSFKSLISLF